MKLTPKQIDKLWGESGPYSQANLTIQTRILDDKISRTFLVVEADINPLTYELVKKHQAQFTDDQKILQLLNHAEYRGHEFGYVTSAFEAEYKNESVMREAQERLEFTIETLIKMHEFVMNWMKNN
ncbi:MAG: hypothetical protein Q8M83_05810 [bacterium]|nr:hypothetical protein [bacterium]